MLNPALALHSACDDAASYRGDDCWDYHSASYDRAIERLTELLDYFDALAESVEDRVWESSRSLSQERALIEQLLASIRRRP